MAIIPANKALQILGNQPKVIQSANTPPLDISSPAAAPQPQGFNPVSAFQAFNQKVGEAGKKMAGVLETGAANITKNAARSLGLNCFCVFL